MTTCPPICANVNCKNYDKEAVKAEQFCSLDCIIFPKEEVVRSKPGIEEASLSSFGVTPSLSEQIAIRLAEEGICTVCHAKPCDGKSRYCSPECHIIANGGALLLKEEPQEIVNGLQFSVVPQYELLPREALLRLIRRAELGQKTKGKNAWNALSDNQESLLSKEALCKRLGHAIDHAYKLMDRVVNDKPLFDHDINEDDAAALMWAGMYACCATALIKERSCLPTHSPSKTVSQTISKESSVKQPLTEEGITPPVVL